VGPTIGTCSRTPPPALEDCLRFGPTVTALTLAIAAVSTATAQIAPIGVPKGVVRVELDGRMDIWDTEYRDGTRIGLGADLTTSALGRSILPFLTDADARLERITGIAGYGLDLGRLSTDLQRDESRGYLGLSLGLTRAITVFGRLPLVRARAQSSIALDPSASDAGFNPGADESTFFSQLNGALSTLNTNIGNGSYSGATLALAQATLTSGTELSDDLFAVLSDPAVSSPFVPTSSSAAGAAILARVTALQTTLTNSLGISGFVGSPTLPADAVTRDDFIAFLNNSSGPVGLRTANTTVTFRGDAETGVALTLVDRWDRENRRGGLRAALQGLVRYPTGNVPRADRLFLVGTGDGQTDVEGRATVDLGTGAIGVRLEGDYNRQLAADIESRVTAPSQPLNGVGFISVVRNDPGDVTTLAARPFFRLAPSFALQGTVLHWSRGADEVTYATEADSISDVPATVLETDTKASATVLGLGVTYASFGQLRPGGSGLPVEAGWSYERVVRASGGRVPNKHGFAAWLRIYFGLF
jgi:hypothetical protein